MAAVDAQKVARRTARIDSCSMGMGARSHSVSSWCVLAAARKDKKATTHGTSRGGMLSGQRIAASDVMAAGIKMSMSCFCRSSPPPTVFTSTKAKTKTQVVHRKEMMALMNSLGLRPRWVSVPDECVAYLRRAAQFWLDFKADAGVEEVEARPRMHATAVEHGPAANGSGPRTPFSEDFEGQRGKQARPATPPTEVARIVLGYSPRALVSLAPF